MFVYSLFLPWIDFLTCFCVYKVSFPHGSFSHLLLFVFSVFSPLHFLSASETFLCKGIFRQSLSDDKFRIWNLISIFMGVICVRLYSYTWQSCNSEHISRINSYAILMLIRILDKTIPKDIPNICTYSAHPIHSHTHTHISATMWSGLIKEC